MARRIRAFLAELRRRRVYHVAAVYVVVGLAVLSAAEAILDPLGLSELRPAVVVLTLLGFPLALVLAWAYELRPEERADAEPGRAAAAGEPRGRTSPNVAKADEVPVGGEKRQDSIVVLPFADLSPGSDSEYFADGMTEEIINALVNVSGLRVIARTSAFAFKGTGRDVREIGEELGVGSVLEGSVRRAGERLRITAQLVDAANGHHLWSERYDRELEDVFAVQDEIAGTIARRLEPERTRPPARERSGEGERPTDDLEAYEAFLRGRYHFAEGTPDHHARSVEHYERAVALDPDFAEAHAGLAETLAYWAVIAEPRERFPRVEAAARRALEIDDALAEAHALLASVHFWFDWAWDRSVEVFERAVELNPNSATVHRLYAEALSHFGTRKAVDHARRSRSLDPLSTAANRVLATALVSVGELDEALEYARKTLELAPDLIFGHYQVAQALLVGGRLDEAAAAYEAVLESWPDDLHAAAGLAIARAGTGRREEAREIARELEGRAEAGEGHAAVSAAIANAALGSVDDAFQWLDRAIEARDSFIVTLPRLMVWDPLRSDARFDALLARLDFPEWTYRPAGTEEARST